MSLDRLLYVRLMGGLGNQMFQYAFAKSTALAINAELVIDPRYILRKGHHTGLAIQEFNIQARLATSEELARFPEWRIRLSRALRKWIRPTLSQYHESGLNYDPQAQNRKYGDMVSGFWQSEHYFLHIRETLLRELTLKKPIPLVCQEWVELIQSSDYSVSVHIRRGDYLKSIKTQNKHGSCSLDYYQNGMAYVAKKLNIKNPVFFIFSDDVEWVRANINPIGQIHIVSNAELRPEHDLYLMSLCRHHVISNSTFSWWGAWLHRPALEDDPNQNDSSISQLVIAPTPWYADPLMQTQDLCPQRWLLIDRDHNHE